MSQQFDIVGNLLLKVDGAEAGLNKLKSSLSKLTLPKNIDSGLKKSFSNLDELFARYKAQLKDGFQTKSDVSAFTKTAKAINTEYDKISQKLNQLNNTNVTFNVKSDAIKEAEKNLNHLLETKNKLIKDTESAIGGDLAKITKAGSRSANAKDLANQLGVAINNGEMQKAVELAERLKLKMVDLKSAQDSWSKMGSNTTLTATLDNIISACRTGANGFNNLEKETTEAAQALAALQTGELEKLDGVLSGMTGDWEKNTSAIRAASGEMQEYARSSQSMSQQLGDLQQSTQYFFSLRNMINLFRRGIDDAIQSVKELDKAMTDTAVVTDYKVSDMWNMLPQYTQIANELGATTQGAYETMTLYFQQGLDQQQAFELGAETMKMARIAGLEYAETTDMMTAALRGFNMELNETSARRINDVYSKLAAVTASDTEELGTAMQRTASIAHSAGMSFEGTTAFLAQAIETTREPAENIGTAMKTIIARFQEMKKNPLEISEVEGEEVNFNKVDAALKTIGVDLKDTNGQFRELDKVFLDISERWDSLSQTQQRYIATTAAGSRQQSRFIAMMDNYERTVELVSAANNSAGASNEQFNKTMDSLEAKLNKLHNAWQAFTMGIANNGMIKLAVDGVTTFLTVTNKLIDTLSLGSGVLKSFLSIFMAFNGLKATGKIANALIGGLGGMVDPKSSFAAGFRGGAVGKNSAQAINQPIVKELQSIRNLIAQKINQTDLGKGSVIGPYDEYNRFKQARMSIASLNSENTVKDLTKQLAGISGKNQNLLMRGNAATFQAATNSLINSYGTKNLKEVKVGERFLNDQRKSAQITAEEYYSALQDPGLLKQAMVKAGIQQNNPAYAYMDGLDQAITIKAKDLQDQAIKQAKYAAAETGRGTKEVFDKITQGLTTDKAGEYFRQKAISEQGMGLDKIKLNTSKMGAILDGIGSIGTGISQAGMGIQAFGSILMSSANPALQAFGSALTSIGGLINGLGMSISGISSAFTAISGSKLITNIAGTGTVFGGLMTAAGALTGGLLLLGGVIAALVIGIKKHNDNIKKAAEEVSTTYKEKNEKAQTNINNLQSWKEDFARLSGGVDENGYNVNLSTEDYDRYLEIIRGIAEINPSIVEGYNAQGQAIITNNKALEETLQLEKEHQKEAFNEYISPESLKKLQQARDLSKQTKVLQKESTISQWGVNTKTKTTVATGEVEFKPQATMRKQAQKIGKTLQDGIKEGWATEDLLKDFNIDIGKLAEGDEETLRKFEQFGPKIQQRISSSMDTAGDDIKDSTKNAMSKALSGYGEAVDELDELITPTYEYLMASTTKYATSIPTEFKKYFNQGLKDIASDANITDIDKAARDFASTFETLTKEGGDYYELLQDATEAQNAYAESLNADAYNEFIEGADGARARIEALEQSLTESGMDLTQGYGKAIKEFLDNELHQMENFTQAGVANLQYALNTMVDQITAAEGALENFNKIAEGSTYGKAASNMSQIFETATADEHILGEGDQAFWAGAEAIVGRQNLLEGGKVTKDKALKQMKEIQEMLKGGQEGWDNFKIKWFDNADLNSAVVDGVRRLRDEAGNIIQGLTLDDNGWISEIDENINPEVYDQIADALDMSKESLIAMLNLGRQFGEISFTNIDEVRKALATSDTTIKNAETGKVFVRKEDLESEMTQAGIDLNQQQEIETDLHKNHNVDFIKAAEDITKSNEQFTDMGINSMESLVKTFDATGQFTKDEIAAYAEKYADINNLDNWQTAFNEAWNQNQTDQEFGGIPNSLTTIQSILTSIDGHLADQRLSEGYLDKTTAQASKEWLYGEKGEDTSAQHFWKGHGSGQSGEITTSEFNKTSKELSDFIQKGTDYVTKLDEAKQTALKRGDTSEAVKIEAERLAYEQMLTNATKYLNEGTETYNQQIQTKLDGLQKDTDLVNKGFSDLFANITPESINTDQAQAALNQLYQAAINNTPAILTDGLMSQMQNLGIDIQRAIDAGLIVDTNHIYDFAQKTGQETGEAGVEGETSGLTNTDTTPAKKAGKQKGKETGETGVQGYVEGQESITPPSTSMPQGVLKAEEHDSKIKIEAEVDEPVLEKAKTLIVEVQELAGQGATFAINVSDNGLKEAAKRAKTITNASGDKSINITANGLEDTNALTEAVKTFSNLKNKTIKLKVDVSGVSDVNSAIRAANSFYLLKDDKVTLTTIKETITKNNATGSHNHGYFSAPPKAGSAARGNYGQLGPKGKGGLTLTGELGYEVAWIPSENRSMILGANGPQMINLPGDAVVWNHEQSKQILKQKSIPAGSHYVTSKGALDPRTASGGGDTSIQDTVKDTSNKINKTIQDTSNTVATEAQKTATKLVRVSVWWENIARKTEATQRQMDNAQKQFENYLKKMTATLDGVASEEGGNSNAYIQKITEYMGYNQAQVKQADKELQVLTTNPKSLKTKAQKKADKAVKKAKKTKDKEDDKEAKKKQKEANYNAGAAVQVSYEKTVTNKKTGKKEKKTVTSIVNTAPYIKKDGTIDESKLKTIKNKNKRKAVADALNQEINDKLNKKYKAEDAIAKAQEALDKIGQDIYETFFNWKSELSEVWVITQKIAQLEQEISKNKTIASLYEAQLASGKATADENFNQKVIDNFTKTVEKQALQVQREGDLASAAYNELNSKLALTEETTQAQRLTNELNNTADLDKQLGISEALQKLSEEVTAKSQVTNYANITQRSDGTVDIDFNKEALYRDRDAGKLTGDAAKVIEDYVNDLIETSGQISEHVEKQISVGAELYNTLASLKEEQAQNAEQLVQITKENNSKELDKLKKLNDSITKALKELLDGVRKKLDERRTQETNAKTERDISQKQQRLAALRADTSGGHQVEIAQLEKEISEAQTNYQQSLEDQLVDRLQTQADEAAAQRERQIELQEALIESTDNITKVNMWMKDPAQFEKEIKEAYKQVNNYDNVTDVQREVINSKAEQFWSDIKTNHAKQVEADKQIANIQNIVNNAVAEGVKGTTPPNTAEQITQAGAAAAAQIASAAADAETQRQNAVAAEQAKAKALDDYAIAKNAVVANGFTKDTLKNLEAKADAAGINRQTAVHETINADGSGGKATWKSLFTTLANMKVSDSTWKYYGEINKYSKAAANTANPIVLKDKKGIARKWKYTRFAKGGFADYTGPAWLDGTPSKPELILNATDTQNFLALRDVLSKALDSTNSVTNSYGGNATYEININVDKIEKDYDVDRVAERVKKIIVKDSGYRNVTQVRNFR